MKTNLPAALRLTACFVLASGVSAHAQTAGEMLHACELLQRGMHSEGEKVYLPPASGALKCWGFMEAVLQYATLADRDGKTWLGACPGPDTSVPDVIRVFVGYANAHPEKRDLKAAAAAYNAMADAFPCEAPSE